MLGLGFYNSFSKLSDHLTSLKVWPVFLGGTSGKEPTCQCRRHNRSWFDPWVGKVPWRKAWKSTPVFLPGESHGQRNLSVHRVHRVGQSQTWLQHLSMTCCRHAHTSSPPSFQAFVRKKLCPHLLLVLTFCFKSRDFCAPNPCPA